MRACPYRVPLCRPQRTRRSDSTCESGTWSRAGTCSGCPLPRRANWHVHTVSPAPLVLPASARAGVTSPGERQPLRGELETRGGKGAGASPKVRMTQPSSEQPQVNGDGGAVSARRDESSPAWLSLTHHFFHVSYKSNEKMDVIAVQPRLEVQFQNRGASSSMCAWRNPPGGPGWKVQVPKKPHSLPLADLGDPFHPQRLWFSGARRGTKGTGNQWAWTES